MLTPYWQLDATDATRLTWAIRRWIAHDHETGAYLWSGRQRNRYGVTIPASNNRDNVYLRFRASDDRAAFAKACTRIAKWSSNHPAPPK